MTQTQTPAERRILADFPQAALNAMRAETDAAVAATDASLAQLKALAEKPLFDHGAPWAGQWIEDEIAKAADNGDTK